MAIVIAGDRSGVGKTTITLSLLASLHRRGLSVQSFKVGPDYIDPMFHGHVTGRPCRNLDPVLTSESYVQQCFCSHTQGVEFALVEGVMGLFDGTTPPNPPWIPPPPPLKRGSPEDAALLYQGGGRDWGSTAHVARLLDLPIALVIDCGGLSGSVAAIAHGYRSLDPRLKFAGVVLNRVGSDRHLELLKDALEPLQIPVLGVLRRETAIAIPDRHLGLVPVAEMPNLDEILDKLAHIGYCSFDWDGLLPLLKIEEKTAQTQRTQRENSLRWRSCGSKSKIRVAIARDAAFSFYYQDNLEALEALGAELVAWSPLTDACLPPGVQGMYFGGGFPEMFAAQLSENTQAREAVREALHAGMPTYAECGGLMYLCENIVDFDGQSWGMVGAIASTAAMGKRLTLGYRRATAVQDSPMLEAGERVCGHEFHRSQLSVEPASPLFEICGYGARSQFAGEGWCGRSLHASYVHLHWGDRPEIPARFLQHCAAFNAEAQQ